MIDLNKAKKEFKKFINKYDDQEQIGFKLKVKHTYQVEETAKIIATKLNLSKEDIELAELIGILHDIGRFEELNVIKQFDNIKFDHASYGVKLLFEDNLIRNFIDDDQYDEIIKAAIKNHSALSIEDGLDERCLLHSKIIRDADKIDNYRVKIEEVVESIFPGKMEDKKEIEESTITDKVYQTVKEEKCVDIRDRKTILDYWVCVLAFTFDLNFKESYLTLKENDYINRLIDRFEYKNKDAKEKMESIRQILLNFIENKIKNDGE